MIGRSMPKKPLEGIKVIDFTWAAVGPLTVKTLADYGAEVIKLEGRSRPSNMRVIGPFKDNTVGLDRSGTFNQWETGKLSVAINLKKPKGVELAKKFVAWADVVVESMAGGVMKRMGLGYDELKKVNPDIIMLSTCMMGQTGPQSSQPGYGNPLTALAGFNYIAGWPDREPAGLWAYTDFISPHFNTLAILAALEYRRRTGKGQYIDIAQYETSIQFMTPAILDYVVNGRTASRMGNRCDYAAPHGVYPCLGDDRWCTIAIFNDEEWNAFVNVIGHSEWTGDPRFATLMARKDNEDELDKLIGEWTINCPPEEIMTLLQSAGVEAGVVENAEDLQENDPQLKHRHLYWRLEHPDIGEYTAPRTVFTLSKSPCSVERAPLLGEHNEYALKKILDLSDEEVSELVIDGTLE